MASEFVFVMPGTTRRWSGDAVIRERHWRPTLRRAKVRYRYPYQTRHTFASRLLIAGEPELLVARLLGHATVEMIRRHYGRWIPQPDGVRLRGDYAGELGAGSGRQGPVSEAFSDPSPLRRLKDKAG
jgi:integrase